MSLSKATGGCSQCEGVTAENDWLRVENARLRVEVRQLRGTTPVDWPARFRAAGTAVHESGRWPLTAQHFDDIADRLESGLLPPHVVEAIGRVLLGEEE